MTSDDSLNHGAMWYGWLKRIKKHLQRSHRHHLQLVRDNLTSLKLKWLATRRAYECGSAALDEVNAARLALDNARTEHRQHLLDQQFDFHANVNERGSSHFFRRPKGLKVSITSVNVNGVPVTDDDVVKATFTAHWKSIMVAPEAHPPLNRARRRAVHSVKSWTVP
ncbi:hypothetical protein ACHHYP_16421 [Achlya hypogyna]|uniref:Uncharacterized protein n=1 Tax=Achlya hypogyna TaxID=1202772 RepID=A0A1V9Y7Z3_ACHHY|nr:hypothetical protein ACHHYP_16421 [Achlya hypogyna]